MKRLVSSRRCPRRISFTALFRLRRGRGQSLQQIIRGLNPVLRGWMAYFRLSEVKNVLEELDGWAAALAANAAVAAMEARLSASAESDEGRDRYGSGVEVGHQRAGPMVEWRRLAHEPSLSQVLVRPHGAGFVVGYSATLPVCFMNRRMPNGTSGGPDFEGHARSGVLLVVSRSLQETFIPRVGANWVKIRVHFDWPQAGEFAAVAFLQRS